MAFVEPVMPLTKGLSMIGQMDDKFLLKSLILTK